MRKRHTITHPAKRSANGQPKAVDPQDNGTWHLIAAKAYELFEQHGRVDGHDLDDWLTAEALVSAGGLKTWPKMFGCDTPFRPTAGEKDRIIPKEVAR